MEVFIKPTWNWTSRWHSQKEVFWIIVDNEEEIMHIESFVISSKQVFEKTDIEQNFFLPFRDFKTTYYRLIVTSDQWIMEPEQII